MANTKQAEKMIRKTERNTRYNKWWKSKIKEAFKNLDLIAAKPSVTAEELKAEKSKIQKIIDKATKNKVIHQNKSNRMKSKILKNQLGK
ncbi:hypothetical protein A2982_03650 [candidate division WWE3 bacterium RIFCSPLOWO2_01_FULL_39_13]|uniref:Small ribosomal subunit protein bS20 n=1 Tax=candidate division WWE3 bacterium RIFCSPLOWO2_01_FULL_39_13 TaxID=1802624 RepID=A0A1F4V562_UNCKA|nr:MAG: hypothetical protein A2982_03650 [candidate division WWE3 bacterium RIFCSPLOWO2_01_FULL_39_13]